MSVEGQTAGCLELRAHSSRIPKFQEFADSSGMTRHILAERLKRLVEEGVLERRLYSSAPKRYDYVLTEKGEELRPALRIMKDWGKKHMPVRRAAAEG
ncbi:MAG: helix-turn-helix domain-containing protein [Hyphomonas sp.]|nr:helix-turn-helix domain-containing protein [Hyphomonas sp.]